MSDKSREGLKRAAEAKRKKLAKEAAEGAKAAQAARAARGLADLAARRTAMAGLGQLMADAMKPDPVPDEWVVTNAGVYPAIPEHIYHQDMVAGGSLSSTGARLLLPPSCPALFHWRRTHPLESDTFDFGKAAHQMVLGTGPDIIEVPYDNYYTNAAKKLKEEARKAGAVPLLTKDLRKVEAIADAIQTHPLASRLFDPAYGDPEQTLVWQDDETGIWCRARLDWQPHAGWLADYVVVDLKTAASADKGQFARSAANYGYPQQAAHYIDGAKALDLDPDPLFAFVVVEKDPPHLVNVIQLDDLSIEAGRRRNRQALQIYKACSDSGVWYGYSDDVELVTVPTWYLTDPIP